MSEIFQMKALSKERFDGLMGSTRSPMTKIAGIEKERYSERDEKVLCALTVHHTGLKHK